MQYTIRCPQIRDSQLIGGNFTIFVSHKSLMDSLKGIKTKLKNKEIKIKINTRFPEATRKLEKMRQILKRIQKIDPKEYSKDKADFNNGKWRFPVF